MEFAGNGIALKHQRMTERLRARQFLRFCRGGRLRRLGIGASAARAAKYQRREQRKNCRSGNSQHALSMPDSVLAEVPEPVSRSVVARRGFSCGIEWPQICRLESV